MRFLIVGGGGLGTVLAGYLARSGHEVTLFVKPGQAAAFTEPAVHISGLAEFSAPVSVASEVGRLGSFDYLIVCVKARDTEAALAPLRAVSAGAVLSLQNGVGKDDVPARLLGPGRVLGALTGVGGTLLRPGYALHSLAGATVVGEIDGRTSPRGEQLASAIREAGLPASCEPDIVPREWQKLAIFLRTALVCSITRADIATVMLDSDLVRVCMAVAGEVAAVARAEGQSIDTMSIWVTPSVSFGHTDAEILAGLTAIANDLRAGGVPLYPSLAQDTMAGRPTELEATAGDVIARAARHRLPAPSLTTCYRLLRGLERIEPQAPATSRSS
ncbi:MAG: ketopantoate reductase family protein [Chloroflexi bacterium]|nr:ketopantoate reductase family protein [Chloroflexota bacterium]